MVKFNLVDGSPRGISLKDSCTIAEAFASCEVDILAPSGGLILQNGLFMLRGHVPLKEMIRAQSSFLKRIALLVFGPFLIPPIDFRESFFKSAALCVLRTIAKYNLEHKKSVIVCLLGGIHSMDALNSALLSGFPLVQMGRALLYDSDLPHSWLDQSSNNAELTTNCTKCNQCIVDATMNQVPIHCVEW